MKCRSIRLSRPRRFIGDLMAVSAKIPTVPVQRRMNLRAVADARDAADKPSWPAIFMKAYGAVAQRTPALRRAYVSLPWPRLVEYPNSVANMAIERDYQGEPAVFFARIRSPDDQTIAQMDELVRDFRTRPINEISRFQRMLRFAGLPRLFRRPLFRLALNLPRLRPKMFGTFGLTVYSSLGAESLHPISPLPTTLTYGVIDEEGDVNVRVTYDHRVLDGATVARALVELEGELKGPVLSELFSMAKATMRRRAALRSGPSAEQNERAPGERRGLQSFQK